MNAENADAIAVSRSSVSGSDRCFIAALQRAVRAAPALTYSSGPIVVYRHIVIPIPSHCDLAMQETRGFSSAILKINKRVN